MEIMEPAASPIILSPAALRISESEESDDPSWDAFVARAPGGDHVQTSLWGQVKSILGWKAARVMLSDREQIVAGAQLLYYSVTPGVRVGYVTKGPLAVSNNVAWARLLIQKLHEVCRRHRVRYLIVQPPNDGQQLCPLLPTWGFRETTNDTTPTASVLIDLSLDLEAILQSMKRQNRQNIRRAEREGIIVREGNRGDMESFYHNYQLTSRRQEFEPYPQAYFYQMWDVLHKHDYVALLVSEREGEPISGLLVVPFGGTVIAKLFGWSGQYGSSRPNEAVFWGAIQWAKAHGYRYFDLQGIEPEGARAVLAGQPLPEALLHTPTFMKLQFGGQVCLFPSAFEYVYNPIIRWSYYCVLPYLRKSGAVAHLRNRARKMSRKGAEGTG